MKDSLGRELYPVLNERGREKLLRIGNSNVLRLVAITFENICVDYTDIKKHLSLTESEFLKVVDKAVSVGLIKVYRDSQRKRHFVPNVDFLPNMVCDKCTKWKNGKCILKSKTINCSNNYVRAVVELCERIRRMGLKPVKQEVITGNKWYEEKHKFQVVTEWKSGDFYKYLKKKYEVYNHLVKIKTDGIVKFVHFMREALKVEFGDKWGYVFKLYIDAEFVKADKEGYVPSLRIMKDKNCLQKFVDNNPAIYYTCCVRRGLYCPHASKSGKKCTLKGMVCTSKLVKKVRKSYN